MQRPVAMGILTVDNSLELIVVFLVFSAFFTDYPLGLVFLVLLSGEIHQSHKTSG